MTRRIIASLAAAGVAILASCTQDQRPSAPLPTEASLARTPAPAACSFTTIGQDAKNIYTNTSGQTKDQVFALIDVMSAAYRTGGAEGATSAGFDVLQRYGNAAGTVDIKSTVTAAQLSLAANHVLLCMSVPGYVYSEGLFTNSFLPTGLFAVRSVDDVDPVVARSGRYGSEPIDQVIEGVLVQAKWPLSGAKTVAGLTIGKALFYASTKTPSAFFDDPLAGPTVVDMNTLPTPLTFAPKIRVGFCDMNFAEGRILHAHTGDPALVLAPSAPTFCSGFVGSAAAPSSMFASAAQKLGTWLAPRPAFAASRSMMFLAFGGGAAGGYSEFGPVSVQDTLIITPIPNAAVSDTIKTTDPDTINTLQFSPVVTVQALSMTGQNPLGGVTVTLHVVGNKGSFVAKDTVAVTDSLGYARFPNFSINKAGGYTVTAKAPEFGPTSSTSLSNLFNISGQ